MTIKIWKVDSTSPAQIAVQRESVTMVGDSKHFIKTSEKGNVLYGPTSIVAGSESIRTGGIFVSLPDMAQGLPSTMATPLPGKIPVPPIHVAFDLATDVGYFMSLLF